ncbi:hypothetical protein FA95DRAFT_1609024 [Auriscalpium vulgare]|uniref:Uncharacterized protein n=1 Tax=Auriscalpium vulgare TaxID=40419 RepID=A0ACB8RIW0_9AGAM|nr:hypothetical protein FA95DRAFT_1609024 [Auriscalpium vulgare]
MPNALYHIVLEVELELGDVITVDIHVSPYGTLAISWARAGAEDAPFHSSGPLPPPPRLAQRLFEVPMRGAPVIRTVALELKVPADVGSLSVLTRSEDAGVARGRPDEEE